MKRFLSVLAVAGSILGSTPSPAHAQSEASVGLSMFPVASVVGAASVAAGALVAVPAAISATGSVLTIRAVEASAGGMVWVLERASDGARASVEISGRALRSASVAVGTSVLVSVIASGTLLSVAGEVIAFVPNELGRSLLHDERVTR